MKSIRLERVFFFVLDCPYMDQTRWEELTRKVQDGSASEEEKLEYLQALNATLQGMRDILEQK